MTDWQKRAAADLEKLSETWKAWRAELKNAHCPLKKAYEIFAAIGGANIASEGLYGGQIGLINWCGDPDGDEANRSVGAQIGLVNCSSSFAGLQYGALNVARGRFYGLQDGAINVTGGLVTGIQCGFVNYSGDVYGAQCGYYMILGVNIAGGSVNGCQLGLVNYATDMGYGLQIGGINIIASNGWLMVLPLFNWHF